MNKKDLFELGSQIAKNGFKNEINVIEKFNNWHDNKLGQEWLKAMNYNLDEIEFVKANKIQGNFKSDIQVQISVEIKLKKLLDVQNLQVKLVSNPSGFNQINKRWTDKYVELWNIPNDVAIMLKHFTGEIKPYIANTKDSRRIFMNEFTQNEQKLIIDFIRINQSLIVSDILKGRGQFAAEWMLVII